MNPPEDRETLHIKKYPNRRFYDSTHSRHVTIQELHEAVLQGHTLLVTDTRTGEDITNVILVQIILEKDPPKLSLFPSWVLHAMVRSKPSAVRLMLDRVMGPLTHPMAQTQRQWDELMNRALTGRMLTPAEWAEAMMRAFNPAPGGEPASDSETSAPPTESVETAPDHADAASLRELRRQVEELRQRLEGLDPSRKS